MLQVGLKIKEIRAKKGFLQKQVAEAADLHPANYNKMEKGEREPSVEALNKIAKLFELTVDQVINYEGDLPKDVSVEDKTTLEKVKMIEALEEEDKQALFRIIDGMLTKAKFKDFFQKKYGYFIDFNKN